MDNRNGKGWKKESEGKEEERENFNKLSNSKLLSKSFQKKTNNRLKNILMVCVQKFINYS